MYIPDGNAMMEYSDCVCGKPTQVCLYLLLEYLEEVFPLFNILSMDDMSLSLQCDRLFFSLQESSVSVFSTAAAVASNSCTTTIY